MYRCAILCLFLTSPAIAEVCDRSVYPLAEAEEGDPVREARIDFTYESGVIVQADGARATVYCIRNDESPPIFFKWHGPKPGVLFESYATGQNDTDKSQNDFTTTTTEDRTIEYGLTRNYGSETEGETITFTDANINAPIAPVQATPLDLVGLSMPEVLANPDSLDRYLDAYRNAPGGGNELAIWTYARNWLPADTEVLSQLAVGEGVEENYDGPYIPVSYGLRSAIDIDNRVATSSVQFWFGHFTADGEAFALAQEAEIRNRLSVVTADGPFPGLADLETDASYPLSEAEAFLSRDVLEAKVGGGETAEIVPWTVGVAFDGIPFSAMQAELFAN